MVKPKQIPIEKQNQTLEQQTKEQHEKVVAKQQDEAHKQQLAQAHGAPWANEVTSWIDHMNQDMQNNINRMQQAMMPLVPMNEWDFDRWHHFGMPMLSHFPGFGSNMFEQIERDMEAQRQKILSEANMNQLVPKPETIGEMMNVWKNAYEIGDDGQLHFKVRFNVAGYKPESVNVGCVKNKLMVHAKEDVVSEDGATKSHKEFSRSITLPDSVQSDKFTCKLTDDGVLILEAPVTNPNYHAITFDKEKKLAIKPNEETPLPLTGSVGLVNTGEGVDRKLHFEMPVEPVYHAEDIRVRTDSNKICIDGHKVVEGVKHEFSQTIESPETIDPAHVRAQLNKHTLVVEAPYVNLHQ